MRIPRSLIFLVCLVCAEAAHVKITLLATTDLHGNILPYDYFTAKPAARGLAKIASLIAEARAENPNNILIDCGDTIQGTPLEYVHQRDVRRGRSERADPMMLGMNLLGYDAMVVGNHEFNYGLKNLTRARKLIERAHAAAPRNPAILDSLGWVHFRQGSASEALPFLRAAYADDRDGDIAAHLGEVLWQVGQQEEAQRIWSEASAIEPENQLLKSTRHRLTNAN